MLHIWLSWSLKLEDSHYFSLILLTFLSSDCWLESIVINSYKMWCLISSLWCCSKYIFYHRNHSKSVDLWKIDNYLFIESSAKLLIFMQISIVIWYNNLYITDMQTISGNQQYNLYLIYWHVMLNTGTALCQKEYT